MDLQARQQRPAHLKAEIFERKEKLAALEHDPDPPGGPEAVCVCICMYVRMRTCMLEYESEYESV